MAEEDPYHLEPFLQTQEGVFETALGELTRGRRESHRMWFIFPQMEGLARSSIARLYEIKSRAEAEAYLHIPSWPNGCGNARKGYSRSEEKL